MSGLEISQYERAVERLSQWLVAHPAGQLVAALPQLAERLGELLDEELVAVSHWARQVGKRAFLVHCVSLYVFRERYRDDPTWAQRAALIYELSPVTVRRDARIGADILAWAKEAQTWALEAIEQAGDRQLRALARQDVKDRMAALDALCRYIAETGDREVEGFLGRLRAEGLLTGAPGYRYVCPACGYEGRLREFRRRDEEEVTEDGS